MQVEISSGSEIPSHTESGMRFMLTPRSANVKHSSIPENSQGIRNLSGSPSFLVQTLGSGISILLAVGTPSTGSGNLYCQWELSPSSGNALCILFPTYQTSLAIPIGLETKRSASSRVMQVEISSESEIHSHTESGMRFMLTPRSANAKHSSIPEKSQGIRNLSGSPSFLGNFFRMTVKQWSFIGF
nr:hypothetical protein [Tanacetum cinerariifolium]